jgi:rod shape-determining protein MreD
VKAAGLLLLALVLEAFRLAVFSRLPVVPDFTLGIVVLVALTRRPPAGAAAGLALGAMRDIIYGGPVGVEALALTGVGGAVGSLGKAIYREAAITHALMIFSAAVGRGLFVYLVVVRLETVGWFEYLWRTTVPSALATAVLVPLVYHFLPRRRRRRLRTHEKKVLLQQR